MTTQNKNTHIAKNNKIAKNTNSNQNDEPNETKKTYGLLDGPDPEVIRVVKSTLYHLDGTRSYIVTKMTNYTHWHTAHVQAAEAINEYIYYLASKFIQISKFHTEIGTLRGEVFTACPVPHISTNPIAIPFGKVFVPGTQGRWVTPAEAKKLEGGSNNAN